MFAATKRKGTPFDVQILNCLENLSSSQPEPNLSTWEKFGILVGTQIGKLKTDVQKFDVQIKILEILRDAMRESVME